MHDPADFVNDLYRYSPSGNKWTKLYPSGVAPSPRELMGFAATPDGTLYVFGGLGSRPYGAGDAPRPPL
jgi:hypothetical protein